MSGLGAVPFEMDAGRRRGGDRLAEGVDVLPRLGDDRRLVARPGGDGAREDAALLSRPRAHREAATGGETPFTPAIAVVFQVDEGLRLMVQEEGAEAIFARHEACVPLRHEPGWPASI